VLLCLEKFVAPNVKGTNGAGRRSNWPGHTVPVRLGLLRGSLNAVCSLPHLPCSGCIPVRERHMRTGRRCQSACCLDHNIVPFAASRAAFGMPTCQCARCTPMMVRRTEQWGVEQLDAVGSGNCAVAARCAARFSLQRGVSQQQQHQTTADGSTAVWQHHRDRETPDLSYAALQ
jgi:hypothetical protein